jgi:hypothetical protein
VSEATFPPDLKRVPNVSAGKSSAGRYSDNYNLISRLYSSFLLETFPSLLSPFAKTFVLKACCLDELIGPI